MFSFQCTLYVVTYHCVPTSLNNTCMRSPYAPREVQPFDTCMKQWQTPSSELQSNQTKTIEITGTHDCIIVSVVNNTINVLKELLFFMKIYVGIY